MKNTSSYKEKTTSQGWFFVAGPRIENRACPLIVRAQRDKNWGPHDYESPRCYLAPFDSVNNSVYLEQVFLFSILRISTAHSENYL